MANTLGGWGSLSTWMPEDNYLYGASINPYTVIAAGSTLGTGRVGLARIKWGSTRSVLTFYTYVHTAGSGLTAAQNLMALYDGSGNLIAGTTSPDQTTAWASAGLITATLSAAVSIPKDPTGFIYGACLVKGTTPPIFRGTATGTALANVGLSNANNATLAGGLAFGQDASTGNTTMPSTVAPITMAAFNPWFFAVGP